ncbi:MAG: hypothetical protein ACLQGP_37550 [Isosphaeraceae bacterium]
MFAERFDELSCKIFCEAAYKQKDLADLLAGRAMGEVSYGTASPVLKSAAGELELRRNPDRNKISARQFPDGFLHFRYALEFYRHPGVRHEEELDYVARLLALLWSHKFPAVAACDYDDELPHQGGYKDSSLPWPSTSLFHNLGPEHSR